jgi:hypothetical protein
MGIKFNIHTKFEYSISYLDQIILSYLLSNSYLFSINSNQFDKKIHGYGENIAVLRQIRWVFTYIFRGSEINWYIELHMMTMMRIIMFTKRFTI